MLSKSQFLAASMATMAGILTIFLSSYLMQAKPAATFLPDLIQVLENRLNPFAR
ncbi:hypothetical protein [Aestuariispira insulae]|uniref:Uncharacterized protein n=1 Tax=Aestuariispira insulae TaxID=1461337 RepID=A0A3D9HIE1_9PROT|nr:hypothetical protein [Aestuariispira insulae]RED49031.1 hypothetical protein DFP90_1067 [Aestuariispira insulae]